MSKIPTILKQKQNTRKREHFPYEIIISTETKSNPTELRDTTLSLCKAYRIPFNKISVWIQEKSQEKLFRETLLPGTFGKLLVGGVPNEYFEIGTPLVYMNSCIRGFFEYDNQYADSKKPVKSLLAVLKSAFYECEKEKANLWGCVHLDSKKKLKSKITTKLKLIPNTFWGTIYSGVDVGLKPSQDAERSILYYKADQKIIYLKNIGVNTCLKKIEKDQKEIKELLRKYPEFILIEKTESGKKFILYDLRKSLHTNHDRK
jgi:hypothetical protein